ncbi:MAG: NADH-quinone oxidoreductase subunit L [SAR202 cluster bacterium]|nr:NADH-quinone oxidoreductase subunit L [SAR202 cluster bacterium]|tara:strand:+ start:5251 stop:7146 length:1896 start_codon:yes stop_codon:yes gene_type:complete
MDPISDNLNNTGVQIAWIAPALGVLSFTVLVLFRKYLPQQGSFISIASMLASFGVFCYVLNSFMSSGGGVFSVEWFNIGTHSFTLGIIVDELSLVMLGLVTFVAANVQVFSIGYMKGDGSFGWYFAVHSLFAASMLMLVLSDNLLLLYMAWELVGVCSYLLIGFWYEKRSAAEAAKKAFVTTRIGDIGLLVGILLLYKATGTFNILDIFHAASNGGVDSTILTSSLLLIFLGAMGKSAQFPLHVWLPDAMEGPTPVSALIHAATMVVAGVFLVARLFPIFTTTESTMFIISTVGLTTALLTAGIALVMTDLKRVLAYSTISHLGFMMLTLGSFGYTAALFHLITHAFAKALLFLCAGSIAHGTNDVRDIRKMGGLWRRMPITSGVFSIGLFALAGIPPLSGFFSKDEILVAILDNGNLLFFSLTVLAALLSSLYMARLFFLVVLGPLKAENEHAHESPLVMTVPLILLAFLSIFAGLIGPGFAGYSGIGDWLFFDKPHHYHINFLVATLSLFAGIGGFVLGWMIYYRGIYSSSLISKRFSRVHNLLENKYYIDEFYQKIIDTVALAFARFLANFDRVVINDAAVNGTGRSVFLSGWRLRYLETGKVYNYALGMALGLVSIGLFWWFVVPSI